MIKDQSVRDSVREILEIAQEGNSGNQQAPGDHHR